MSGETGVGPRFFSMKDGRSHFRRAYTPGVFPEGEIRHDLLRRGPGIRRVAGDGVAEVVWVAQTEYPIGPVQVEKALFADDALVVFMDRARDPVLHPHDGGDDALVRRGSLLPEVGELGNFPTLDG